MQIAITGRHMHLNALEKEVLSEKLRKFEKKVPGITKIDVVVNMEGERHSLEAIVHVAHSAPLVAKAEASSNLMAMDMVVAKLDNMAVKLHGKKQDRQKGGGDRTEEEGF